jgi:hypothetical protein
MSGRRSNVEHVDFPDAAAVLDVLTFVLALATAAMAWAIIQQTRLTRIQVERAHRPVLVPFQQAAADVQFRGGTVLAGGGPTIVENAADRPDLPRYSAALLAVTNVGMGPALNVRGGFTGPRGAARARFPTEAVGVGGRAVVAFETWTGESLGYTGNDASVAAMLEYDDVAGQTYRTEITFDVGSNAYRSDLVRPANDTPTQTL